MEKITLMFFLCFLCHSLEFKSVFRGSGHTSQVNTIAFFKNGKRMATGAQDYKIKIWSLENFTVLFEKTYSDQIMFIGLHPNDNRIFVSVYDGTNQVLSPNTYSVVTTFSNPSGSPNSFNYIVFDTISDRFLAGGYDAAAPKVYFFNATTYAYLSYSASTSFDSTDQINSISLNPEGTRLAVTNIGSINTKACIQFFKLSDRSSIDSFSQNSVTIKWGLFDSHQDNLCVSRSDDFIKCYKWNQNTNHYTLDKSWSTSSIGHPYALNFKMEGSLILTIGNKIVFYNMLANPTPQNYLNYTDQQDIFVIQSTSDASYLATGMRNGQITIWKKQVTNSQTDLYLPPPLDLILGLSLGLGLLLLVLIIGGFIWYQKFSRPSGIKNEQQTAASMKKDFGETRQVQILQKYETVKVDKAKPAQTSHDDDNSLSSFNTPNQPYPHMTEK